MNVIIVLTKKESCGLYKVLHASIVTETCPSKNQAEEGGRGAFWCPYRWVSNIKKIMHPYTGIPTSERHRM